MALPKTQHPLYDAELPSSKFDKKPTKVKYRPMLVKEEKILNIAKESNDYRQILLAVKQIVQNCVETDGFDVNKIKIFDLEYLYLQIHSVSVSSVSSAVYMDNEDGKEYTVNVDLSKIDVKLPENEPDYFVKLTDTTGIKLKWPETTVYDDKDYRELESEEILQNFIIECMESYIDGDSVTVIKNEKPEDVKEFVDNLDIKTYNSIKDFVSNIPSLYHETSYTNSKGTKRDIVYSSLSDFFIF